VFRGHPSWLSLRGLYLRALLFSLIIGVLAGLAGELATGHQQTWWVIAGVLGAFAWRTGRAQLRRLRTTYRVTERRVTVSRRGLIRRRTREAWLEEVLAVHPRQSGLERMLGIGSVHIICDAQSLTLHGVDDPRGVARRLDRMLAELQPLDAWDERVAV
jgi:uncharacterized membrane protein YdbT with pleckstrin-like domain